MNKFCTVLTTAALMSGMVGCSHKTDKVGRVRPPVDELTDDGRGLQGKDVVTASDAMAQSIMADPLLAASDTRWTIVVDHVENNSSTNRLNFDIFLQRLRSNLSRYGKGRVQLIENRVKLDQLQSAELDGQPDRFGQGGTGAPVQGRVQPNLSLYAKIADLPSGKANYVNISFTLTNLRTREIVWEDMYEVAVWR